MGTWVAHDTGNLSAKFGTRAPCSFRVILMNGTDVPVYSDDDDRQSNLSTGWSQKTDTLCFMRLNFIKFLPIFKLIYCLNQENICNNTVAKDSTTPQVCRYTTLWNVSVSKATIENKTTSVTTHFKSALYGSKVDTLNIWTITAGCQLL